MAGGVSHCDLRGVSQVQLPIINHKGDSVLNFGSQ